MELPLLKSLLNSWTPFRQSRPLLRGRFVALSMLAALLTAIPVRAADKVSFIYGPLLNSFQVSSLADFAKTGAVDSDLSFYFTIAKVNAEGKQKFREALTAPVKIDPILLSRFFYSEMGEAVLTRFGQYFQIPYQGNGMYALRSALILSAFDPQGLTLLSFIQKYPTNLYIDVGQSLKAFDYLQQMIKATNFFTTKMAQFAAQEATGKIVDFSAIPDIRQPGSYTTRQQRWVLQDMSRDRQLYTIVVQPEQIGEKTPVVIISHGLGARPEDFVERAQHLASYGFVVVMPQHPGSDHEQVQKLKQGLSRSYFLTNEFIDRPRDISFVIDELERRNQSEFGGRLNLQSVGVAGHSFGGYTVLAVAGATIDFANLQAECDRPFAYQNISLLLQCQALSLPRQAYNFRDHRVNAVLAANPVNYSIFGSKGLSQIQIPVFIVGGNYDVATPAAFEQARTFPLLGSSVKYLALAEGQAHVNLAKLDDGLVRMLDSIPGLTLADPALIGENIEALSLAFFATHTVGNTAYQPYLQASYMNYLNQDQKFKFYLITATSNEAMEGAIAEYKAKNN